MRRKPIGLPPHILHKNYAAAVLHFDLTPRVGGLYQTEFPENDARSNTTQQAPSAINLSIKVLLSAAYVGLEPCVAD